MKKYLFLFFIVSPLWGEQQEQEAILKDLSGGVVTNISANKIPDNSATWIQNFLTDFEPVAIERNGYVKRDTTVLGGAKPVYGLWEFVDNSGNDWIISYSSRTFYKNTIGQTPTAFGPITTTDQIPDCAKNLGLIVCTNGTDSVWSFNGTSTATISGAPLGKLIEPWRTRFAIANISGALSTVRFSADGSATTWTLGGNPTDPFAIQVGGANDGEYVRCLVGSYLDSMIIGRKYDLWALDGFDQDDVLLRNVSDKVGCIEPRTPQEVDGELVFLSARGLEAMNAREIRLISEPVRNVTDTLVQNTASQRSNTQTTEADFAAGSILPSGKLSTSISPGNVVLSTMAVIISSDDTAADFGAGTLVNLDSTTVSGSLRLSLSPQDLFSDQLWDPADTTCSDPCTGPGYQSRRSFGAGFSLHTAPKLLSTAVVRLRKVGSPGNYNLGLYDGTSSTIGSLIENGSVSASSVGTSTTNITVNFSSSSVLLPGTTYWLVLVPQGTCNSTNKIQWAGLGFATGKCGAADITVSYSLKSFTTTFTVTGNSVSRTFDVGTTTNTWFWNWGALTTSKSTPSGSTITYQTQTSADGSSFDSLVPVSENAITTSTVRRYIRYKASFSTTDQSTSPILNNITFPAGPFISTGGTFTSQLISVGSLITAWGPTTISDVSNSSGTVIHQFGSTNTASVSAITNWTTIVNGGIPTVSTNPYVAFRSSFTAFNYAATPILQEFQTTWTEGGTTPSPVGAVYDRRYWLSYTTNTASTPFLDTVLVWQRSKTFTFFKGINAGSFSFWRDDFYFGNSNSTGYVYKYDVGNNDDGLDVTSIIFSKSYDLEVPYKDKSFRNTYLQFLANTSFSGTFSVAYDLDRLGEEFSLGSIGMNEGVGQLAIKLPFSFQNPVQGREIQYKIRKTGTGDRLRLYDLVVKYNVEEEQ